MKRAALAFLALLSGPASAAIDPQPCEPAPAGDPRVRCADYAPMQVVRIVARVGAHVSIIFGEDATVLDPAGAMFETDQKEAKDWHGISDGNALHIQALKSDLEPTALTVPVRMRNGKVLLHLFELNAGDTNGGLLARLATEADEPDAARREARNRDTMLMVRFRYAAQYETMPPPPRPAAPVGDVVARRSLVASDRIAGRLRQEAFYGQHPRNWDYIARGDRETEPQGISDNGLDTVARFDTGVPIARPYLTQSGECDGKNEVIATFEMLGPGLMRVHGSHAILCFRRSPFATEVRNLAFDPYATNPNTGTISPDVVRVTRRAQ